MSGSNPFRKNPDGGSKPATASASETEQTSELPSTLPFKPTQSTSSQLPDGYSRQPPLSLADETDDSTSTDEQEVDPFNSDPSASDKYDDGEDARSLGSSVLDDRPRGLVGSTPHQSPSDGSLSLLPSKKPYTGVEHSRQSVLSETVTPRMAHDIPSLTRLAGPSPEQGRNTTPSTRAKDKKPPPPPRSHHGKRIGASDETASSFSTAPGRSTNRRSYRASSPESTTSTRLSKTPNASSASQIQSQDYFSMTSDSARVTDSTDTLSRSNSQKRPPTPLSRRQSQMHRSKSTHSKSSGSRMTISSLDLEDNDSSRPPSPRPSTRSVASSLSQDRKRISMPLPSSGEFRATGPLSGPTPDSSYPPSNPQLNQPGRRASSYGNITPGSSSTGPPPPPPPRRARDANIRSSEGGFASRTASTDEVPLPQPSNAHDILADLSRLQKEVDDLRGHYENRKVSH